MRGGLGRTGISQLVNRVAKRFFGVRVMGLAAEMTYYAVLSLIPLTGALGMSLGFLERLVGAEAVGDAEAEIVRGLQAVFSPDATSEVIAPLVAGLLEQERAGFAFGSFLLSLFFASWIFRSAIETLDSVYGVRERRGALSLWMLGIFFALCAVLVATALLFMVVVGPLLGGGQAIADWLGMGPAFEMAWALARWPTVCAIATGFLTLLYHIGPNVRSTWTECLPGAILGTVALVLVAVSFRIYIDATGLQSPEIENTDDAVRVALQVIGVLMMLLFWLWSSAAAVLTGGVVNAELDRLRQDRSLRAVSES